VDAQSMLVIVGVMKGIQSVNFTPKTLISRGHPANSMSPRK